MTTARRTIAGRYALGDVLGRGGMADVHRADDLLLERPVAVKLLRESADQAVDRARFTSEIRLLAGLNHPGLVKVLDAGTTPEDQPYLVLELVEGPTLRGLMSAGPMADARVADLGRQLAAGLAHAHAHGVVHRDVKPGNVLVDASGRVRLADFGIARVIGDTVRHTQTGQAIGTAAYLSPEQVRGDEVTGAADVYSLGLVLLEALSGERAFPGAPTEAAIARLSRSPRLPDSLTPAWRRLLASMTATAPAARPTAAQVAAELDLSATAPFASAGPPREATSVMTAVRPVAGRTTASGAPAARGPARGPFPRRVAAVVLAAAAVVVATAVALAQGGSATPGSGDDPPVSASAAASPSASPASPSRGPSASASASPAAAATGGSSPAPTAATSPTVAASTPAAGPGQAGPAAAGPGKGKGNGKGKDKGPGGPGKPTKPKGKPGGR